MNPKLRVFPGDDPEEAVARLQAPSFEAALELARLSGDRVLEPCRLRQVSIRRQHAEKGRRVSVSLVWHAPVAQPELRAMLEGLVGRAFNP